MKKRISILFILSIIFISCNNNDNEYKQYYEFFKSNELKIPIIEASIGTEKFGFIVDSGANISLIDSTWYSKNSHLFKNEGTSEIWITGVSGIVKSNTTIISSDLNNSLTYFSTSDLRPVLNALQEQKITVIGILGSEYLQHHNLVIDYYKQSIYSGKE
jgi:hypothetical protein